MNRFAISALAVLLSACQTMYDGNEDSPYYLVPVGSTLILHNAVAIPPQRAGVYLQGGQILPLAQVNQYYPHCKFEVRAPREMAQTVTPDEFAIAKSVQEVVHAMRADHIQLARVSVGISIGLGIDGGGPSVQTYATRMDLRSANQPEVFRLTCGQWEYPPFARHVTIGEMRRALGAVFTLRLAAGGG